MSLAVIVLGVERPLDELVGHFDADLGQVFATSSAASSVGVPACVSPSTMKLMDAAVFVQADAVRVLLGIAASSAACSPRPDRT